MKATLKLKYAMLDRIKEPEKSAPIGRIDRTYMSLYAS